MSNGGGSIIERRRIFVIKSDNDWKEYQKLRDKIRPRDIILESHYVKANEAIGIYLIYKH